MRRASFLWGLLALSAGCNNWDALSVNWDGKGNCLAFASAGATHTCARRSNGVLYCWGDNRFGQLGVADAEPRVQPVRVDSSGRSVLRVALPAGEGPISSSVAGFSCAIYSDSTIGCWGDNRYGQLGTGDKNSRVVPVVVSAAPPTRLSVSGARHTCTLATDDRVFCWGANESGQLGVGSSEGSEAPVQVLVGSLVTERLAAGARFTCARATDGTLLCWGSNEAGQLGTGDVVDRPLPARASAIDFPVIKLAAGEQHLCVTSADGSVFCIGGNLHGQLGVGDQFLGVTLRQAGTGVMPPIASLNAGGRHTCALGTDGTLWCWGDNQHGQLGTGDNETRTTPVQVSPELLGSQVASFTTGGAHTCAVKTDGSLYCWGDNSYGQLGTGRGSSSSAPQRIFPPCE